MDNIYLFDDTRIMIINIYLMMMNFADPSLFACVVLFSIFIFFKNSIMFAYVHRLRRSLSK